MRRRHSASQFYRPSPQETPPRRPPRGSVRTRIATALVADPNVGGNARRLIRALLLLGLGLVMALGAAIADVYLHRGIETSAEPPYVEQVSGRDLATNIDLRPFPEAQIESIASTLRTSGFGYVRQPFSWAELEPEQGQYRWEEYDAIVRNLNDAGISIVAVVFDTPQWARAPDAPPGVVAPPINVGDFASFMTAFVGRYGAYVDFVQIWDKPNSADYWGGRPASAEEYVSLLAPAFNAIRTADSQTRVLLAELADNVEPGGFGADVAYLRSIYRVGGASYFDVATASIDGGSASPYDRRVSNLKPALSRAVLFREVLLDNDDDTKPIWLTHYGWDGINTVSRVDQADYLAAGIQRIRAEWPWSGPVFQWALLPEQTVRGDEGRALLNADGTATVAFDSVTELAQEGVGSVAPTGFVPMDSRPVLYSGGWADQHLSGNVFKTTSETGATVSISFEGTGLIAYLRRSPDAGLIHATIDGRPLPGWDTEDGAAVIDLQFFQAQDVAVTLANNIEDGVHEVTLVLAGPGQITMGGAVVSRDPPLRWPVVVAIISALALSIFAVREVISVAAERGGMMRSREESSNAPPLPSLPDWRPSLRT